MNTVEVLAILGEFAEDQFGMVTSKQAVVNQVPAMAMTRLTAGGAIERIVHGVYRIRGGADHQYPELYAEWLNLAPAMPAWRRSGAEGLVSHQSAAALYQLGDLNAAVNEFTLPQRRQTQRIDLRLHRRRTIGVEGVDWEWVQGLAVTRPVHIIGDLLADRQDPSAIATICQQALHRKLVDRTELETAAAKWGAPYGPGTPTRRDLVPWLATMTLTPAS